ncbi:hypothetical protein AAVH_35587 [Aphelenchoides avenae]|nr:hypothetical protein AAVH_35587 [Aphelenchus avenae]
MRPAVDPAVYSVLDREATRLKLSKRYRKTLITAVFLVVVGEKSHDAAKRKAETKASTQDINKLATFARLNNLFVPGEEAPPAAQNDVETATLADASSSSGAEAEMSDESAANEAPRPAVSTAKPTFRGAQQRSISSLVSDGERSQQSYGGISSPRKRRSTSV